jgi:hypothetical protein
LLRAIPLIEHVSLDQQCWHEGDEEYQYDLALEVLPEPRFGLLFICHRLVPHEGIRTGVRDKVLLEGLPRPSIALFPDHHRQ